MRRALLLAMTFVACAVPVRAQGTIRGVVYDSLLTGAPLEGATVIVAGSMTSARTDRRGRYVLRGLPAGRQVLTFSHPRFDALEVSMPSYALELGAAGTVNVDLATPAPPTVHERLCGGQLETASAVLFGLIRAAEDASPLAGAEARAYWYEIELGKGQSARQVERAVATQTDSAGRFLLCGVPFDIALTLIASKEGQVTGPLYLQMGAVPLERRDITLSIRDTAARHLPEAAATDTTPMRGAPGSASLRVRVRNAAGRGVRGAIVGIRGTAIAATTGPTGEVLLRDLPAGSQTLLVRAIGLAPSYRVVALRPGAEAVAEIDAARIAALLPSMSIIGMGPDRVVAEYERRRKLGFGYYVDGPQVLDARWSVAFWAQFPGVTAQVLGGSDVVPRMRGNLGTPCTPTLFVDGLRIGTAGGWELSGALLNARRMEVYTSASRTPAEFITGDVTGCGVVAVWSK